MSKITITIPVFNEGAHLAAALESVLNQSYGNLEVIVSDNHSTDDSASIIERFRAADTRIKVLRPAQHLQAFKHIHFIREHVIAGDGIGVIGIGGHDVIAANYVELLAAALAKCANACLISPTGVRMRDDGSVEGVYPGLPQLRDSPMVTNPFTVLSAISYNVPIFGLVRKEFYNQVSMRYSCYGADLLYVAELSAIGQIIVEERAIAYIRDQKANNSGQGNNYDIKFFGSPTNAQSAVDQFNLQLKWIQDIAALAVRDYPYVDVKILTLSLMGCYFSRWAPIQFSQASREGAFEKWLTTDPGRQLAGGMHQLFDLLSTSLTQRVQNG